MSLDISLAIDTPIKKVSTGVFARIDGTNKELTLEEIKERWPNHTAHETEIETYEVFDYNLTHNLTTMCKAGKLGEIKLYEALWRPDENDYQVASELITPLALAYSELSLNSEYYKTFNPENGWGSFDNLYDCVKEYLKACIEYPSARIEVDR